MSDRFESGSKTKSVDIGMFGCDERFALISAPSSHDGRRLLHGRQNGAREDYNAKSCRLVSNII